MVVFGIPGEKADLKVSVLDELFTKKFGVKATSVERLHRIGRIRTGKSRPIILNLYDYNEKMFILRKSSQLKGTGIFLSHDCSQASLSKRKFLWNSAKTDEENGAKVMLINDKLMVNEFLYFWDESVGERRPVNTGADKPSATDD